LVDGSDLFSLPVIVRRKAGAPVQRSRAGAQGTRNRQLDTFAVLPSEQHAT
jgi:hypothetical protein